MKTCRYIPQFILLGLLAYSTGAAQQRNLTSRPGAASAQGQLSVTITIAPSVGIVLDDQGNPWLIMANAASPNDNISWLQPTAINEIHRTLEPASKDSAKKKNSH